MTMLFAAARSNTAFTRSIPAAGGQRLDVMADNLSSEEDRQLLNEAQDSCVSWRQHRCKAIVNRNQPAPRVEEDAVRLEHALHAGLRRPRRIETAGSTKSLRVKRRRRGPVSQGCWAYGRRRGARVGGAQIRARRRPSKRR